jgi:hypothetical protein
MLAIPPDLACAFESLLANHSVPVPQRPYYLKWLRHYLDFCQRYSLSAKDRWSFAAFDEKSREKNQSDDQRRQARHAMALYYRGVLPIIDPVAPGPPHADNGSGAPVPMTETATGETAPREPTRAMPIQPNIPPVVKPPMVSSPPPDHPIPPLIWSAAVPQTTPEIPGRACRAATGASWVWVYDKLSSAIRVRHYSPRTLEIYKFWTQRLQTHTRSKDPNSVSMEDVKGFLNFLAVEKQVSASSQNQAFNALLFLFRHVLEQKKFKPAATASGLAGASRKFGPH